MATKSKVKTSAVYDWRTTDQQEIDRRKIRAQEERFLISNKDPKFPIFSTFKVASPSIISTSPGGTGNADTRWLRANW